MSDSSSIVVYPSSPPMTFSKSLLKLSHEIINDQALLEKQEIERQMEKFVQTNQNSLVDETVSFFERIDPIIHILKAKLENQLSSNKIGVMRSKPFRISRIMMGDFHCPMCNKRFVRKGHYENHRRKHILEKMKFANDKLLHCKFCQYGAMLMAELVSYPHNQQAGERLRCKFCSKLFNLSTELIKHVADHCVCTPNQLNDRNKPSRWIYMEKKRFKCRFCSRMFDRKFNFRRHLRTHRCIICRKQFSDEVPCKHIALCTTETVG